MFFQNTIIKKYLAVLNEEQVNAAWETYKALFLNQIRQDNILASKEEQFQEGFLRDLFVKTLGYTINPDPDFNLITEKKNETDSKKADGAIQRDGKVIGIIELKDHKTPNLKQVETQAFGYKNQHKGTRYVIISNFEKLRFFIDDATEFREWDLFALKEEEFRELYFCLSWGTLSKDLPIKAKNESVSNEDQITLQLYRDYSTFKRELFADILKNNTTDDTPKEHILLLFKKTQKLLDRLLFIFFAEDCDLLPPNMMLQIINEWEQLKALDVEIPLYIRIKQYFGYLDAGNDKKNIFAYNGGLFKPDEVLDELTISDNLLALYTKKLSEYDYASEVDVNILGHIFENSLSEIEEVTAQINAGQATSPVSKRKRDGVFYTPQYITKYIVEHTVGRLCSEKKAELGIDESEYFADKNRKMATKKRLVDNLAAYRNWLLEISICDPACGSGAFLNAALRFLMDEHKLIDEMEAKVTESPMPMPYIRNVILEKNLFGVDINEESVEIAKLALWLRTAEPNRKLSSLNNNIKCGNSLISNPEIAGDKAFNWQSEFPQVFAKGGFDIVIGNPPYVQLQSMGEMSDAYAACGYQVYNKSADLYCLFYEKGCSLLKEEGYLGFIASNKWLKINYGESLRKYLVTEMNPLLLVDFPGVPVFEDATVDPQILIVQRQKYSGVTEACAIKAKGENIADFVENNKTNLLLTSEPWTIRDGRISAILAKMDSCGNALRNLPIEINNGIKTGFNDAFYINGETRQKLITEDIRSAEIISPLLRGRDITAWVTENQDMYLINPHNGIKEKNIPPINIEDYPAIKNYLDQYITQLTKRGDKGETPYNMRNCAYLDEFAKPKIVYPNMTKYLPFCYDETKSSANQKCYILTTKDESISLKFLTAVFNSKLIKLWIRCVCPELGEDRREIGKIYFEKLHVPTDNQQPFIDLADSMLALNKELLETRKRFIRRLQDNIPEVKINGALEVFDSLDFNGFVTELKKQKIRLSLFQQDEWEKYFNKNKQDCEALSAQIAKTDKEINARVYALYDLTDEEIKLIEQ